MHVLVDHQRAKAHTQQRGSGEIQLPNSGTKDSAPKMWKVMIKDDRKLRFMKQNIIRFLYNPHLLLQQESACTAGWK
jgi:hypothetical protein